MTSETESPAPVTEEEWRKRIRVILTTAAGPPAPCKGPNCGADVWKVTKADGTGRVPFGAEGLNHFITCPDRDSFRRGKRPAPPVAGGEQS